MSRIGTKHVMRERRPRDSGYGSARAMRLTSTCLLALALFAAGCGSRQEPEPSPFRPVTDVSLLMEAILDPQADAIWDSVWTDITEDGTEEVQPSTREEWLAVRNSAFTLAESGNLLMMEPRVVDDGEWVRMSQALVDASMLAVRAAEARNPDELFDAGTTIYSVCTNCHTKYWLSAPTRP